MRRGTLTDPAVEADLARGLEMASLTLGYLGPSGTFSEEAALAYDADRGLALREFPTIAAVLEAVAKGELAEGIVPIENSLEGGVSATLDCLAGDVELYIRRELLCPVRHCLLANSGVTRDEIRRVYSHPQALGQCRAFLEGTLSGAVCRPVESTAAAAVLARRSPGSAAVASRRAANIFGLSILAEDIQDSDDNVTRFVVVGSSDHPPTGRDKTSIVLAVPNAPGSLYRALGFFARCGVNLTRIESKPMRRRPGDWLFFIDCEGHRLEPPLAGLWEELALAVSFVKQLGSYPNGQTRAER